MKSPFNAYKFGCSDGLVEVVEADIISTLCCRHQSQSNEKTLRKWKRKKKGEEWVWCLMQTSASPKHSNITKNFLPAYPNILFYQNLPNPKSGRANKPVFVYLVLTEYMVCDLLINKVWDPLFQVYCLITQTF